MKNNKITFIGLAVGALFVLNARAMEKEKQFCYSEPEFCGRQWQVFAFDKAKTIGEIFYMPHGNHKKCYKKNLCVNYPDCYEMTWFEVGQGYQKKGIGTALFKICIEHMQSKGCPTLMWDAIPQGPQESKMTLKKLIGVYTKMCRKLNLPDPKIIDTSNDEGYAQLMISLPRSFS